MWIRVHRYGYPRYRDRNQPILLNIDNITSVYRYIDGKNEREVTKIKTLDGGCYEVKESLEQIEMMINSAEERWRRC